MASRNFKVKVIVEDAATNKFKRVRQEIKRTGKAVDDSSKRFMAFNRTLFTTTAFIGIFVKAFQGINNSLASGAKFDLVEKRFERYFGKSGNLIRMIRQYTNAGVDELEAMQHGVKLASLGLVENQDQTARLLAMGAAAARRAGMDTSEGIKRVTDFMQDHDIAHLQAIGVIAKTNKGFLAQKGALGAVGTSLQQLIQSEHRYTIGMRALRLATREAMFDNMTLADTLKIANSMFTKLSGRLGQFLGKVLGPLVEKMSELVENFSEVIKRMTLNKRFVEVARAVLITTGAVTGLVGALGALKLITMALGSIGFGIPKLIFLLLSGGLAFKTLTDSADDIVERLKLFKAFMTGIWQMITSFDKETGIAKLDKDVQEMLRKNGLLGLAKNIARVSTVIRYFVTDVGSTLISWGKTAFHWISKLIAPFRDLLGIDGQPWARGWIEGLDGIRGMLVKLTAGFIVFKGLKAITKSILGIGGGGGGRGGSPANPMYTKEVGFFGRNAGRGGNLLGGLLGRNTRIFGAQLLRKLGITKVFMQFRNLGKAVKLVGASLLRLDFKMLGRSMNVLKYALSGSVIKMTGMTMALGAAAFAGYKFGQKLMDIFPALGKIGDWAYEKIYGDDKIPEADSDEDIMLRYNHAKKMGWDRGRSFEEYKADVLEKKKLRDEKAKVSAGKGAAKSQVSTPYNVKDEMSKIDEIGSSINTIRDSEHRKMAQAQAEAFYSADSEGGKELTENERRMLLTGIESKEYLKQIANNTKAPNVTETGTRRGK